MKKIASVGLAMAMFVAGCSKAAKNIEATYVSPLTFQHLSCTQVAAEMRRNGRRLAEVTEVHDKEHTKDTAAAIGGFILWPIWIAMAGGGARKEELGRLKGEAEALEQVAIEKECVDILNEIEKARQAAEAENAATGE